MLSIHFQPKPSQVKPLTFWDISLKSKTLEHFLLSHSAYSTSISFHSSTRCLELWNCTFVRVDCGYEPCITVFALQERPGCSNDLKLNSTQLNSESVFNRQLLIKHTVEDLTTQDIAKIEETQHTHCIPRRAFRLDLICAEHNTHRIQVYDLEPATCWWYLWSRVLSDANPILISSFCITQNIFKQEIKRSSVSHVVP